jgi:hypothetical protein
MTKKLSIAIKIVVVYFQISFNEDNLSKKFKMVDVGKI